MKHSPACDCTDCAIDRRHVVVAGLQRYAEIGHDIGPKALTYILELEGEVVRLGGSIAWSRAAHLSIPCPPRAKDFKR